MPAPRMFLEAPRDGDYHGGGDGMLVGHGWVLSPGGVRSTVIEVSGQATAEAVITDHRPDVQRHYPDGGRAQGFRFEFDPTPWRGRTVRVCARIMLADGQCLSRHAMVVVGRKPWPGWLEFLRCRFLGCRTVPPWQILRLFWRAVRHAPRDFRQARMTGRVDRLLLPAAATPSPPQPPWVPSAAELRDLAERVTRLGSAPSITVVVLVGGRAAQELERTTASLRAQVLAPKEVLVPQANHVSMAAWAQACLERAQGAFVVFVDAGDVLPSHALLLLGEAVAAGTADAVYSDECRIDGEVLRDPFFKPDWSPALLLAQPYCLRLCAWRRDLLRAAGDVRVAAGDAWELDLALRATEPGTARVIHVPEILVYRAGPPPQVSAASVAAVTEAAARRGLQASVRPAPNGRCHALSLTPTRPQPITAVIPTRDRLPLLRACVESLLQRTSYPHLQVLVVDNGSQGSDTLAWFARIGRNPRVRVVKDERPFNYSALNNAAVRVCGTPWVLFLNNDVCALEPRWLGEMAALLELPDVVAVGARLLYGDDSVQHAGVALGIGGVAGYPHKRFHREDPGYHDLLLSVREVSAVTGACLLLRRDSFLAVGGFDESLAVAYNDVDLCMRLSAKGRRILWTPWATLRHFESVSRGADRRGQERFDREVAWMHQRWGDALRRDPYHSPRVSLAALDYRPADEQWAAPRRASGHQP